MQKFLTIGLLHALVHISLFAQIKSPPLALASEDKLDSIGLYGFIDSDGKWVITPRFTYYPCGEIRYGYTNGLAVVKYDKYWQIIDARGTSVRPLVGHNFYSRIECGRILVNQYGFWDARKFINDGTWGYVDVGGKVVVTPRYRAAADFSDSIACVGIYRYSPGDAYIDMQGFTVHKPKGTGGNYTDSIAVVQDLKFSTTYYFVNRKGDILDTVNNVTIHDEFSEGCIPVKMSAGYGYLSAKGDTVISPQFNSAGGFHEGLAWVEMDKKYGFIDTGGKVVIEPKFEAVQSFSQGRAAVKMNGKWGFINREGRVVIPCTFGYVEGFRI